MNCPKLVAYSHIAIATDQVFKRHIFKMVLELLLQPCWFYSSAGEWYWCLEAKQQNRQGHFTSFNFKLVQILCNNSKLFTRQSVLDKRNDLLGIQKKHSRTAFFTFIQQSKPFQITCFEHLKVMNAQYKSTVSCYSRKCENTAADSRGASPTRAVFFTLMWLSDGFSP